MTGGVFDVTEFYSEYPHRKELGFYETFQSVFDDLLFSYLVGRPKKTENEPLPKDEHGVLVVFIDDLDRCPKDRVIKVLETIKLFMDKPGCMFVLGADRMVIESALRPTYSGEGEAEKFMDKIVQVTFSLPKVAHDDIQKFMVKQAPEHQALMEEFAPLIARVLDHNIRSVKRFLNNMNLMTSLANNAGTNVSKYPDAILRWSIVDYVYPQLAKLMKEDVQYVQVMVEKITKLEEKQSADEWTLTDEMVRDLGIPDPVVKYLREKKVVDLVKDLPTEEGVMEGLMRLSATTESAEEKREKEAVLGPRVEANMVTVEKGPFLYGEEPEEHVIPNDFEIDIYPVTNEQFRQFVEGGGYANEDLWSKDGWKWKEKQKASQPKYWNDNKWNQPDHPVVGVTWFEAEAFARSVGKRLPTEEEWEKAARGKEGQIYSWEGEFDSAKCNNAASGSEGTTPVTKYVKGRSPYGCYDMAGNVWEWTDSLYDQDKDRRVLRGGSWFYGADFLRASFRGRDAPSDRDDNVGFRCARTSS